MSEKLGQLPWEIDPSQNDMPRRGRKTGQLKGMTYNVPHRRQISVSLLERDIEKVDNIAKELNVARSKVISELISTHPRIIQQT
jgi:hypothetical protein